MSKKFREIENKYVVQDYTKFNLEDLALIVKKSLKQCTKTVKGKSKDIYYHPTNPSKADFIRLRYYTNKYGQLTVKHSDRGTTANRLEIDLPVYDMEEAQALAKQLSHSCAGSIVKNYIVYFLKDGTNVSVYKVNGDNRIFLEIESNSSDKVRRLETEVTKFLKLNKENRSLYQIFFDKSYNG